MEKYSYRDGPVVLVSRPIAFTFPLSYAYLAGYLLQQGEHVKIVFRQADHTALVKQIMDMNPVLVGFGNLYPELREISQLIKMLDQAGRRFPIVIGGQMVSPIPEFAVKVTGADFGVVGEGEIILHQLVCALRQGKDPSDIKGLAIRHGNQAVLTGLGPFIEDLSKLPPVPYELFPETEWLQIGRWYSMNVPQPHWRFNDRVINVHGGRGCPFKCNFCYHHNAAVIGRLT
jgi:anaerobic magnesium-protoporphyrin IX monomethyl ester cyclase